MPVAGQFGLCCCGSGGGTSGPILTKQVRWPWPGWAPLNWPVTPTEPLLTKYLRRVERISLTGVDFGPTFVCLQPVPPHCQVPAFNCYEEREYWYTPIKTAMDTSYEYRVRQSWVPDLKGRGVPGAPDDDLAAESLVDDCGVRSTWTVYDIITDGDDAIWPYCENVCGGGVPSWGLNLCEAALASWEGYAGALVSSTTNDDGTLTTEVYEHGTRTIALSEPYTYMDAYGEAQELLDRFQFDAAPLEVTGYAWPALGSFIWGADALAGQSAILALEPGNFCTDDEVVQDFRAYNSGWFPGSIGRFHDCQWVYLAESYLFGSSGWCLIATEYPEEDGCGVFSTGASTSSSVTAPRAITWGSDGTGSFGVGVAYEGAC